MAGLSENDRIPIIGMKVLTIDQKGDGECEVMVVGGDGENSYSFNVDYNEKDDMELNVYYVCQPGTRFPDSRCTKVDGSNMSAYVANSLKDLKAVVYGKFYEIVERTKRCVQSSPSNYYGGKLECEGASIELECDRSPEVQFSYGKKDDVIIRMNGNISGMFHFEKYSEDFRKIAYHCIDLHQKPGYKKPWFD